MIWEKYTQAPVVIKRARLFRYSLPLAFVLPLKETRLQQRSGVIVELEDIRGRIAYGEAAPLPDFSQETLAEVEQRLHRLVHHLIHNKSQYQQGAYRLPLSATFAIECALLGLTVEQWRPKPVLAPLLTGNERDILGKIERFSTLWPNEVKLKVGRMQLTDDVELVACVLSRLPARVRLRLDANQYWTLKKALLFYDKLSALGQQLPVNWREKIAYIEEPTANPQDFEVFYQQTGIGYAFDESIQQGRTVTIKDQHGLKALIIKPTLVGGVADCYEWVKLAGKYNIRVVFSSAFEASIGLHYIQQMSAYWAPDEWPGLDTASAFRNALVDDMPLPGESLTQAVIKKMELLWEVTKR